MFCNHTLDPEIYVEKYLLKTAQEQKEEDKKLLKSLNVPDAI